MAFTTWNPSDKSAAVTLSGGNLTAVFPANTGARSIYSDSTGKWYWEVLYSSGSGPGIGIANASAALGSVWNTVSNAAVAYNNSVYVNGSNVLAGVTLLAGNTLCIALDLTNKRIWFRYGTGANWNNSGTANPATNAGGFDITVLGTPIYALGCGGGTWTGVADFGDTAFAGTVPSGFTAGFGTGGAAGGSTQARAMVLA